MANLRYDGSLMAKRVNVVQVPTTNFEALLTTNHKMPEDPFYLRYGIFIVEKHLPDIALSDTSTLTAWNGNFY